MMIVIMVIKWINIPVHDFSKTSDKMRVRETSVVPTVRALH